MSLLVQKWSVALDTPRFSVSSAPAGVRRARLSRAVPLTALKVPPTTTVGPLTAIARTTPFVDAVKPGSSVPSERTCARFWRGTPATEEKVPPRYQPPPPSGATARTEPATCGQGAFAAAVEASRRTEPPVYGATRPKLPPM